ncbi:adenylate cyclase [Actinoplanes sp. SE50]|uniref:AAA family ATPase n=1 Tax=unclassified Actinoplanes TaxID=2626549 RepID=UPI00023EC739|nr:MULTISPECIES: AAA family ATPase [unclassified Actinoplanes]AEV82536.1 Adenylyl-sulfate kinase [Actinoplanes sp. SE50/110]ATO80932.1 adenylate cyclase [Actinoplanes sp. SE50]SLL98339.1 adenylate cyclase [Actinoplanes sp. SE50/110]
MVLAVFAGLPGVGKSTLAAAVAAELPAAVLAVDTVDFALQRYAVHEPRPGYAAYGVVAALAEAQLRIGHHVIIDAVSPVKAARDLWVELADRIGVPLRVVEVVCGDDAEHRRRVEARYETRDHEGVPDWVRVLERQSEYEPYLGPRLVVDTHLAQDPAPQVVAYLR